MMRTFWDTQFKFSQILPDFADRLVQLEQDSTAAATGLDLDHLDYGQDPRQWLEVVGGTGPEDVVPVFLHGGYWRALTAEMHRLMLPPLLPFGGHVANVEYRLMPGVRLDDVVADAKSAIRALAERFPQAKLLLIGHSAGAHLAVSILDDDTLAPSCRGAIALSGVYDLAPLRQSFLQDELALTETEVRAHTLTPAYTRKPVLYVNGSAETHEFLRGSALMASTGAAAWHRIEGADHMSLLWASAQTMPDLMTRFRTVETE